MATFIRALVGGDLLAPETLAEMRAITQVPILGAPVPYGLGLQERPTPEGVGVGHGGLNFGYQAGTYTLVDHGVTFSHMHNFLPEQSDSFQGEVARALVQGPGDPVPTCSFDEGAFFDASGGPLLRVRFKGPVNATGAPPRAPGVGTMIADLDEDLPIYGFGISSIYKQQGLQTRLEIESLAPANKPDAQVVIGSVSVDPGAFAQVDELGVFETGALNPGAIYATIADLTLVEGTTDVPRRLCFSGISDFKRPARLALCGGTGATPEADQILRAFASVPITTDPAAVEATLKQLSIPMCLCWDDQGQVGACP